MKQYLTFALFYLYLFLTSANVINIFVLRQNINLFFTQVVEQQHTTNQIINAPLSNLLWNTFS